MQPVERFMSKDVPPPRKTPKRSATLSLAIACACVMSCAESGTRQSGPLTYRNPAQGPQKIKIVAQVASIADPNAVLHTLKSFQTITSQKDPLLERNLLAVASAELERKGFILDEEKPDFYVMATAAMESKRVSRGSLSLGDYGITVPLTQDVHTRIVVVSIYDGPTVREAGEPLEVWRGEAVSSGESSDLLWISKILIPELIGEFPTPTGKGRDRVLYVEPK